MGKGLFSVHLSLPLCLPAGASLCWAPRARVRLQLERQEGVKSVWGHPVSPQDCCEDGWWWHIATKHPVPSTHRHQGSSGSGWQPPESSLAALLPPEPSGCWGLSLLRWGKDLGGAWWHPWELAPRGCLLVRARAGWL